jgi:dTDP-4-dehydrorhamnose reductase
VRRTKAVLIIGGSGFVGSHLAYALRDAYKVYATYFKRQVTIPGVTMLPFHISDRNWGKRLAYNIQPELVIYCAGTNDVDLVEDDQAGMDNIHNRGVAGVLGFTDLFQPKFVLISNNYVFDGLRGNYKETDTLMSVSSLGKFKLSAENYLRGHSLNYVILRSAPLYGRGNGQAISFLDKLRRNLALGQQTLCKTDEVHNFAPVEGLVEAVVTSMETGVRNRVLHYGGLTKMTHCEFAKAFARRFGYDPNLIVGDSPGKANKEGRLLDFSINSTQSIETLKLNAFLLEHGFDLLEKKLVPNLRSPSIT